MAAVNYRRTTRPGGGHLCPVCCRALYIGGEKKKKPIYIILLYILGDIRVVHVTYVFFFVFCLLRLVPAPGRPYNSNNIAYCIYDPASFDIIVTVYIY